MDEIEHHYTILSDVMLNCLVYALFNEVVAIYMRTHVFRCNKILATSLLPSADDSLIAHSCLSHAHHLTLCSHYFAALFYIQALYLHGGHVLIYVSQKRLIARLVSYPSNPLKANKLHIINV